MARYKLIPYFRGSGNKPWSLEVVGDRARVCRGDEVVHDWDYPGCADHVMPPGVAVDGGSMVKLLLWHGPWVGGDTNFQFVLGDRVVRFGMSEVAFDELTRFWERGYLIRTPGVAGRWWRAGLLWLVAGATLSLLSLGVGIAMAVAVVANNGGVIQWVWASGMLGGGLIAIRGWGLMQKYRRWVAVGAELVQDGFRFDEGSSTYPPSLIDIMTGRVREG